MKTLNSTLAQRIIAIGALLTIAVYSLALLNVPLFYDEGAFRRLLGRAFIDGFAQYSLFPVCSDPKLTPILFVPAHALLSSLDELLSWSGARIVPFLTLSLLISVVTLVLRQVAPRSWGYGLAALCGGFIGLSGVGLMLSRWEYIATLHIVACLSTWVLARQAAQSTPVVIVVVTLHLGVALVSLFVHPQGLLVIPLSFMTMFCLLRRRPLMLMAVTLALLLITCEGLSYSKFWCPKDQKLEDAIAENHGVLLSNQISHHSLPARMVLRLTHFGQQFFFQTEEAFSIPVPQVPSPVAFTLNLPVALLVGGQLIALIGVAILLLRDLWRESFLRLKQGEYRQLITLLCGGRALWLGAATLLIIYSFSDVGGVFYRAHYRNLLTAILVAIAFAYAAHKLPLVRIAALATLGLSAVSAGIALIFITPQLARGYESYYVSLQRDWPAFNARVRSIAAQCGITPDDGRVVVDMATYDALRDYPTPIDYNYVWYGDYLKGQFENNRTESQWLSYYKQFNTSGYVVMCRSLSTAKLPIQHRDRDLCCLKF